MALNDYQSIRHGVREGARQTVVRQYPTTERRTDCTTDTAAPDEVKWAICLTKDRIGLGDDVMVRMVFVHEPSAAMPDEGDDSDSPQPADPVRVKVCAQRNIDPVTGALPMIDGITLRSSVEMRMERTLQTSIAGKFGDGVDTDWPECDAT